MVIYQYYFATRSNYQRIWQANEKAVDTLNIDISVLEECIPMDRLRSIILHGLTQLTNQKCSEKM